MQCTSVTPLRDLVSDRRGSLHDVCTDTAHTHTHTHTTDVTSWHGAVVAGVAAVDEMAFECATFLLCLTHSIASILCMHVHVHVHAAAAASSRLSAQVAQRGARLFHRLETCTCMHTRHTPTCRDGLGCTIHSLLTVHVSFSKLTSTSMHHARSCASCSSAVHVRTSVRSRADAIPIPIPIPVPVHLCPCVCIRVGVTHDSNTAILLPLQPRA